VADAMAAVLAVSGAAVVAVVWLLFVA